MFVLIFITHMIKWQLSIHKPSCPKRKELHDTLQMIERNVKHCQNKMKSTGKKNKPEIELEAILCWNHISSKAVNTSTYSVLMGQTVPMLFRNSHSKM